MAIPDQSQTEAVQARMVALEQHPEGAAATGPDRSHQLGIGFRIHLVGLLSVQHADGYSAQRKKVTSGARMEVRIDTSRRDGRGRKWAESR